MVENEVFIIAHGGAGDIPDSRVDCKLKGICRAIREAFNKYDETGNILDATQAAVEYMETDEAFNAGYGSVLTLDGDIELEALVVEGKNMNAGAVTGLKNVLHPISVARLVMEKTPHVLLSGDGVQDFAKNNNIPLQYNLCTDSAKRALAEFINNKNEPSRMEIGSTVGAIGIDNNGHMVSCTSTGGTTGKMKGRVGDTPIPGCGGYADDLIGTISTTGKGDAIMRYNLAQRIISAMEKGVPTQEACESSLKNMKDRIGESALAGAITLGKDRSIGIAFSTERMAWAYKKNDKIHYGINPGQHLIEDF